MHTTIGARVRAALLGWALVGLGLAGLPAAQAQTGALQPRILAAQPAPGATLGAQGIVAVRLAGPAPARPQALCDVAGVRSAVPVEVLAGSRREAALKSLGVPAQERADAAQPWLALRCQAGLPDGVAVSLRWLRPGRPGPQDDRVGYDAWDGQRLDYQARSDWPASITCTRVNAGAGCNPLSAVELVFAQPVRAGDLAQLRLKGPDGRLKAPRWPEGQPTDGWIDRLEFASLGAERAYEVRWPARLENRQGQDLLASARGRAPLAVPMGPYPPLVKFGANFGIAERAGGGVVPLTVRAVEGAPKSPPRLRSLRVTDEAGMIEAYQELMRVTRSDDALAARGEAYDEGFDALEDESAARAAATGATARKRFAFRDPPPGADGRPADTRAVPWLAGQRGVRTQALPRRLDAASFEVLGIPLPEPGLHLLEAESPLLGRSLVEGGRTMHVRSGALVTDLGVHLHRGERLATVWVTRLSTGQPVAGAAVSILDCQARRLAAGRAGAEGWVVLPIKPAQNAYACPLFAFAKVDDDLGFVASSWQRGIETWRFEALNTAEGDSSDRVVHAVIARNLLRPGETLHARLVWRQVNARGELVAPPAGVLPKSVDLLHGGSGERRAVPVQWDARGNAELVARLPEGAKRGAYTIELGGESPRQGFRVEDFRLPVLKAEVLAPAEAQVLPAIAPDQPARVAVPVRLSYLSGGAAAGESVQVFQRLAPLVPRFAAYPDYQFGDDPRWRDETDDDAQALAAEAPSQAVGDDKARKLDADGSLVVHATLARSLPGPRTLITEMEYRDPNGETYRAQGRTPLWPAAMVLGVKTDSWGGPKDRKAEFLALDARGAPVAGVLVRVEGGIDGWVSYRRKTAGGYYGYSSERRPFAPRALCNGRTDARGRFSCTFDVTEGPFDSGSYRVQARAEDAQGRTVAARSMVWVYDGGEVWFAPADHDRMDVLADKARFKPGETATLQVRSPFREATAWVSVMRSGAVVDTLVVPLSGSKPVIQLPIKPSYAPNVFVNVLAVRGRVAEPAPTALVDLARPAYKLGILPLEVGADEQRLKVAVATDKPAYQSREKAKVSIQVTPAAGTLPAEREATVFAIDEALLELWPNGTWDLFKAMTAHRGYGFETASAAMQVIGRRHYGRKALPPGGGGGRSAARELFDTLLLWQGAVALDANGRATVEVPVNDSLTRFRVVVVAQAGTDRFGTGEASFVATKDLQLLSGLPATAREGDRFVAGFTVRNTTPAAMQATVQAQLNEQPLPPQQVALAAGEARVLRWPVQVPAEATELRWRLDARGRTPQGERTDALVLRQPVGPALQPVRYTVATQTLQPGAEALASPIRPPAGSVPGKGEIRVSLSPALATDAAGVRDYMKQYPFYCLEQRASKAVSLKDKLLWQIISDNIERYITPTGLVTYYPNQAGEDGGYDVLTSFVLSAAHEAGWALPPEAERRMLDGLEQFVRGRVERRIGYYGDDAYGLTERKLLALEALARHRKPEPALADSLRLDPATDLPALGHRALVQWLDLLHRVAWPGRDKALAAALAELDRRLVDDQQGGLRLAPRRDDQRWYFMYSEATSQVRLALLALELPALAPRADALARAAVHLQRGGGAWWETQANVWGSLLLDKRAQRATGQVRGTTTLAVGTTVFQHDWARQPEGETYVFPAAALGPAGVGAVALAHRGSGQPVAIAAGTAWAELKAPHERGAELARSVRPIRQQVAGQWTAGDVVEVQVRFKVQQVAGWVVVSDPIPPGATLLGSGLGGQAEIATGERRGWRHPDGSWEAWPAYVERSFTHLRAYYEYLWGDRMTLTYQLRINNAGSFRLPPTQLEAMYDPEVFAYQPNPMLEVK